MKSKLTVFLAICALLVASFAKAAPPAPPCIPPDPAVQLEYIKILRTSGFYPVQGHSMKISFPKCKGYDTLYINGKTPAVVSKYGIRYGYTFEVRPDMNAKKIGFTSTRLDAVDMVKKFEQLSETSEFINKFKIKDGEVSFYDGSVGFSDAACMRCNIYMKYFIKEKVFAYRLPVSASLKSFSEFSLAQKAILKEGISENCLSATKNEIYLKKDFSPPWDKDTSVKKLTFDTLMSKPGKKCTTRYEQAIISNENKTVQFVTWL